jgi:hypothetical protein
MIEPADRWHGRQAGPWMEMKARLQASFPFLTCSAPAKGEQMETEKLTGSSQQVSERVCAVHGHNIAGYDGGKMVCTKCGLAVEEIRKDKQRTASA